MSVDIQLPSGYVLKNKTSRRFPREFFISCERVQTNRAWWKFWLPSFLYSYTVVVSLKDELTKVLPKEGSLDTLKEIAEAMDSK